MKKGGGRKRAFQRAVAMVAAALLALSPGGARGAGVSEARAAERPGVPGGTEPLLLEGGAGDLGTVPGAGDTAALCEEAAAQAFPGDGLVSIGGDAVPQEEDTFQDAGELVFTESGGYANGAYAEWSAVSGMGGYRAYVKKSIDTSWTQLDNELLRRYTDHWRVDALGLAAGSYQIKVEAYASKSAAAPAATQTTGEIAVTTHDRHGFAFTGETTPGAYDLDGTLKDGAIVLYVDNSNFNSISHTFKKDAKGGTITLGGTDGGIKNGVQGIVDSGGYWKYADYNDDAPLCIRVIGLIDSKTGFPSSSWGSSAEGLQIKGTGKVNTKITIEGVGEDATLWGFGILARSSRYVEISNLGLMAFADDGISLDTDNLYSWVHNLDLFYGSTGGDSDQAKGDGSVDVKGDSKYQTYSYIHFWDSGKCSLCGMKSETGPNYITYHHNWFDHSDSRHPRVRTMSVHAYNNFYDGNSKYGAGAAEKSSIFLEANYFRNCQYPMLSSMQGSDTYAGGTAYNSNNGTFSGENGGIIKACGNLFEGDRITVIPYNASEYILKGQKVAWNLPEPSTVQFDAYFVQYRTTRVPEDIKAYVGGVSYTNFDTEMDLGVEASDIDAASEVPAKVMANAGRVGGGDFWWHFDDASADASYALDASLKNAVVNYKTSVLSIGGFSDTVVDASLVDPGYLESLGTDVTSRSQTARYAAGTAHTSYAADHSTGSRVVYTDTATFDATEFLSYVYGTDLSTVTGQDSQDITKDGSSTISYGSSFLLSKVRTVGKSTSGSAGKTDMIALSKPNGSITIRNIPQGSTLTIAAVTDGSAKDSYYEIVDADGTSVKTGTIPGGGATVSVDDLSAGDHTFRYDQSKTDTTNQLRVKTIAVRTKSAEGESGEEPPAEEEGDYTVTVTKGSGVNCDYTGGTYKKGASVSFAASVTDAENTVLQVTAKRTTGSYVIVSESGGTCSFAMPAADVEVTLAAKSRAAVDGPVDDTEYCDVIFNIDNSEKRITLMKGSTIPAAEIPDTSAITGFQYWAIGGVRTDLAAYVVQSDVTVTAVVRQSSSGAKVEETLDAGEFLDRIGAFTNEATFGPSETKGLTNAWSAAGDLNPCTSGRFTLRDWKIPSKSLDTIALLHDGATAGSIDIDAPANATLTLVGRSSGAGKVAHFAIKDSSGEVYLADSRKDSAFTGNAKKEAAETLAYSLGAAGVYTVVYDEAAMAADANAGELRLYSIALSAAAGGSGSGDMPSSGTCRVMFHIGDSALSRTVDAGGAIASYPAVTAPAGKEFKGWSASASGTALINTSTYQVTEDVDLYAVFGDAQQASGSGTYPVAVTATGVESSLQAGDYYEGTVLAFTAAAADGYKDAVVTARVENGEEAALTPDAAGNYSFTVTAATAVSMTATVDDTPAAERFAVTVSAEGASASLASGSTYAAGASVRFTAAANSGYGNLTVSARDADGGEVAVAEASGGYSFTMPAKAVTVTVRATASSGGEAVDEAFVAESFLTGIGAWTNTAVFGAVTADDKGLEASWTAAGHEGYNPYEVAGGRIMLQDWTIPSKTKVTVGLNKSGYKGKLHIDAPAGATFAITARNSGQVTLADGSKVNKVAYFTIKDASGNEIAEKDGKESKFSTNASTADKAETLTFVFSDAGTYTLAYDEAKMSAAGDLESELRIFSMTLKAEAAAPGPGPDPSSPSVIIRRDGVAVTGTAVAVEQGGMIALTAERSPADAEGTISWESSNPSVAMVDNGTVTAVTVGTAVVTARLGSTASASVTVRVTAKGVATYALGFFAAHVKTDLTEGRTYAAGEVVSFTAEAEAGYQDVTVRAQASTGKELALTANGNTYSFTMPAEAVIVDMSAAEIPAEQTVVIIKRDGAALNDGATVTVTQGTTLALTAEKSPADAAGTVTWATSDSRVAAVDAGAVTTGRIGTATVTASLGTSARASLTIEVVRERDEWGSIQDDSLRRDIFGGDSSRIPDAVWYAVYNGSTYTQISAGQRGAIYAAAYTGDKITFDDALSVYFGSTKLVQNRDYTLSYANNVKVSAVDPTVTVIGKGNYASREVFTFAITRADIRDAELVEEAVVTAAIGDKLSKAAPSLTYRGRKLAENRDYRLVWTNVTKEKNINSAATETVTKDTEYAVTIDGMDQFDRSWSYAVRVKAVDARDSSVVQMGKVKSAVRRVEYDENAGVTMLDLFGGNNPVIRVTNGATALTYGTGGHFTASFPEGDDHRSAGKHTVVLLGTEAKVGGFSCVGSRTVSYEIVGTPISRVKFACFSQTAEYTGSAIQLEDLFKYNEKQRSDRSLYPVGASDKPVLYVAVGGAKRRLTEGEDYAWSMEGSGVVGTRMILTITGLGAYSGTLQKKITVKPYNIKTEKDTGMDARRMISVEFDEDAVYSKAGAKPAVAVRYGSALLQEGVDYTVTYKNNRKLATRTDAKAPCAIITGKGNFTGKTTEYLASSHFDIAKAPVTDIKVVSADKVYKESAKDNGWLSKPKLVNDGKNVTIGANKDVEAISASAIKYLYKESISVKTTDGKTVDRWAGEEVGAGDIVPAGTEIRVVVPVTCSQASSFTSGGAATTIEGSYRIVETDIKSARVSLKDAASLSYHNGSSISLAPADLAVSVGGTSLRAGTDYIVESVANSRFVGTAVVVVRGQGKYGGTKTVKLRVSAKDL